MATTYTKLRDGSWGIRIEGRAPSPGATVAVMKKCGEQKTETVEKVVWQGDGIALCSIVQSAAPASAGSGRGSGRSSGGCAECGRGGKLVRDLEDGLLKHYRCCDMPPG